MEDIVPDFSATSLDGQIVNLSDFQGRQVVVLDFWATWCGPCIDGMPALQELHEEFDEKGVEVLAINVGERVDTVQAFIDSTGYSFRVVLDPAEDIKRLYRVDGIPQLIVVDQEGHPQHIEIGYPDSEKGANERKKRLKNRLEKLLKQPTTAT